MTPPGPYHVVREGNTLYGVARALLGGITNYPALRAANSHIRDPDRIWPGDIVILPSQGETPGLLQRHMEQEATSEAEAIQAFVTDFGRRVRDVKRALRELTTSAMELKRLREELETNAKLMDDTERLGIFAPASPGSWLAPASDACVNWILEGPDGVQDSGPAASLMIAGRSVSATLAVPIIMTAASVYGSFRDMAFVTSELVSPGSWGNTGAEYHSRWRTHQQLTAQWHRAADALLEKEAENSVYGVLNTAELDALYALEP